MGCRLSAVEWQSPPSFSRSILLSNRIVGKRANLATKSLLPRIEGRRFFRALDLAADFQPRP